MILSPSDKSGYFPGVSAVDDELNGLLYFAQSQCEGPYGANRLLDQQSFTHIITVNPAFWTANIPYFPLSDTPSPSLEYRIHSRNAGNYRMSIWQLAQSDQFSIDYEIGQLNLFTPATEVKLTYTAGFDFSTDTPEVRSIKAIAGVIVDWAAKRFYGQLDSYLSNPAGDSDVVSWNAAPLDRWLQVVMSPLKKYSPRPSGG